MVVVGYSFPKLAKILKKTTLNSLAVLGEISIRGTMIKVEELANSLQVSLDSRANLKVLLPITSATALGTVLAELIARLEKAW